MSSLPGADDLNATMAKLQEYWTHHNKYHAASACDNCGGIVRHEDWCQIVNAGVQYAFAIVDSPGFMTTRDHIILHALGVRWNACAGKCVA